jgi:asparagine synthase (glutamine-hydrolysing)
MCGISAVVSFEGSAVSWPDDKALSHRGPDRTCRHTEQGIDVIFDRLAIHDVSEAGDQPFFHGPHLLCCNGEIYNYQEIKESLDIQVSSESDCAVLLPLLHDIHFGSLVPFLMDLDGVFAMVMINRETKKMTVIRDAIGVKPLFFRHDSKTKTTWVASEAKRLESCPPSCDPTEEVTPGTVMTFSEKGIDAWSFWKPPGLLRSVKQHEITGQLRCLLIDSVRKRMGSDRGLCCMLSGGLDSSVVAAILQSELKKTDKVLDTFSVGFPDSTDMVFAREVATFLGTRHHEVHITYEQALDVLPEVVFAIESYDTTTVRASTPMYLLSKAIAAASHRVVFSGEGSDELFAGYLYNHLAPSPEAVRMDATRLVSELYQYDVLRADRCTSAHGLEFREPFLDQNLVSWALGLPGDLIAPKLVDGRTIEKFWLREAFRGWLPDSVIDRRKAAFSDAVSGSQKPWFRYIHERFGLRDAKEEHDLYRRWFEDRFQSYSRDHIPLWLPRWAQAPTDEPSATTLSVYEAKEHEPSEQLLS